MIFIPFRRELDDVFQSDRAIGWKIGGGAFATSFAVVAKLLEGVRKGHLPAMSPVAIFGVGAVSAALGAFAGMALTLSDVVRRRVEDGQPVNPLLRLCFAMGGWTLAIWLMTALALALAITFLIISSVGR